MKLNKWTFALAAAGVVSLASAVKAEEKVVNSVQTALSSTTISGYVDTSAQWNLGTGNQNLPPYKFGGAAKADGFNLDVVDLTIEKPLDESEWAAGYRVDLWFGPDANTLGTQSILSSGPSDFAIRQAYLRLRMPIGNGIDWKIGVFDSIVGYETLDSYLNPNYTRSYGHSIEPQTHTGILASYRFCDFFTASAGVANTVNSAINSRAQMGGLGGFPAGFALPLNNFFAANTVPTPISGGSDARAESYKSYMGSVTLTAPNTMGFLEGSSLYAGIVNGFNGSIYGSGLGDQQTSYYIGATLRTPVEGLRLGASFDYLDLQKYNDNFLDSTLTAHNLTGDGSGLALAGYASFQATEKLSFHGRAEYTELRLDGNLDAGTAAFAAKDNIFDLTGTVQYDLWQNVISRVEVRWDHSCSGRLFGGSTFGAAPGLKNEVLLAGNLIYKF